MVSKTFYFVLEVFLLVLFLVVIAITFLSQLLVHGGKATGVVSNMTREPEEVVETIPRRSLEIKDTDSPDVMIYKLLRNFDPLFLNETSGRKIFYNSFILDLKGFEYGDGTPTSIIRGDNQIFIDMMREGLKNFSSVDEFYQIGNFFPPSCGAVTSNNKIDFYSNDCWDSSIDIEPSPCKIYVNAYTDHGFNYHVFKNKVKIRVVWYDTRSTINDKEVMHAIVSVCNYNAASA